VKDVAAARDDATRVAIASAFVGDRIARGAGADDELIARCVQRLEESAGRVPIEDLLDGAGVGRRQLERRFRDAVGVPPRLFASILRFRRVFDVLEGPEAARWADAALAAGYFDQSHLIRDSRRFLGCTPAQFIATRGDLAAALVEG
jgi:methylphosphotriester-DNA--protein-cysteine methyltransferase